MYTLDVTLVGGPMEDYDDQEILRRIDILGRQTLHDLHEAIFDAFERWEEHLYEFNLAQDRAIVRRFTPIPVTGRRRTKQPAILRQLSWQHWINSDRTALRLHL